MNYLLDTNVVSELVKANPNPKVIQWIDSIDSENFFLSVITFGEIIKGIAGIQDPKRLKKILHWLEVELPEYFQDRILAIDLNIANSWGRLQSNAKGIILPAIDALIAATAEAYDLTLVTRNTKDFIHSPVTIFNPWED